MIDQSPSRHPIPRTSAPRRRGAALIIALLICIVLVSLVLTYGRNIRVEMQAASNYEASAQAMAVARGAVEAVRIMGDDAPVEAVDVGEGTYWILHPGYGDDGTYAFGLADEGGRINLNYASREMLSKLPRMTDETASAIIGWRGDGAEGDGWGYGSLDESYRNKGEAFETVAELMLVHGMDAIVLFGEDANFNGMLDPNEDDGDLLAPPDNADGKLDRGLWDLVTIHSREAEGGDGTVGEADTGSEESPGLGEDEESGGEGGGGRGGQVDANSSRRSELREALAEALGEERASEVASRIRSNRPHRNLIDLMYKAELTPDEMPMIEGIITVSRRGGGGRGGDGEGGGDGGGEGGGEGGGIGGGEGEGAEANEGLRQAAIVNVNTAPREVLAALPALDEADADALISQRESGGIDGILASAEAIAAGDVMGSIAWVTQVLDREKAVAIGDVITTRSFVRSADIVAISPDGRAFERVRVVLDFSEGEGQLQSWQRLTHRGWPLPRDWQRQLREGVAASELEIDRTGAGG